MALAITKLLPYPRASHPSGQIWFQGRDLLKEEERALNHVRGRQISYIFQEPLTALNALHTIEDQIGEVLDLHLKVSKAKRREKVLGLLNEVGLSGLKERLGAYPHELSGGQRQRIMIAIALAADPKILIADEPTTALDVTTQARILELLKDLAGKKDLSIILITHDLNVVKRVADQVLVMHQGKLVEQGSLEQIIHQPKHSYTKALLSAEPSGRPAPVTSENVVLEAQNLEVHFPMKRGLFKRSQGYICALEQINFTLHQGETLGVVGESGSGKTTLAHACLKLLSLSQGDLYLQGTNYTHLKGKSLKSYRRHLQMVFQDPFGSLSPRMSAGEIVGEGLGIHNICDSNQVDSLICKTLEEVGLDPDLKSRYPHEFSGGQRQRLSLARALVLRPKVIILDEPTSALDRSIQSQIIDLLRDLQKRHNLSYLFISHDLKVVKALAHKIIILKEGKILESGVCEKVFQTPENSYTKALIKASLL